jgi:hypothetical protein
MMAVNNNRAMLCMVLAIVLCVQQSVAFSSPSIYKSKAVATQYSYPAAPLRVAARSSPLFMGSEEEAESPPGEDASAVVSTIEKDEEPVEEKKKSKFGILKIIPLFLKFCVVLAVKFVTDVLVFPPLFLWRMVRLVFRRLTGDGSNGKSGATSS